MTRRMKDSGINWIGDIPDDWKVSKIKYVSQLNKKSLTDNTPDDYEFNYVDIGSVSLEKGIEKMELMSFSNAPSRARRIVEKGDVIVSTVRTYLKAITRIDYEGNIVVSTGFAVLTPTQMDEKFLEFYCKSSLFTDKVSSESVGISYPAINSSDLVNINILCPPRDEQKKIARFLEEKIARIDLIIEKTKISIEELKIYKNILISEVVTKGFRTNLVMKNSGIDSIPSFPEHWTFIKIKYLLNERKEKSIEGLEEPLSMSQKYGLVKTKDLDIPNPPTSNIGSKIVKKGDLVFNKLKAHLGVFSVSKYDGLVSPDYAVYYAINNEIVNVKYLEYLFKTPFYINEFVKYSRGIAVGLTRLYTSDLFNIRCTLPPLAEQEEIVDSLDNKIKEINNLINQKTQLITEISEYKNSLIFEYVTGKKEVM